MQLYIQHSLQYIGVFSQAHRCIHDTKLGGVGVGDRRCVPSLGMLRYETVETPDFMMPYNYFIHK